MQVFTWLANLSFHLLPLWLQNVVVIDSESCQRWFPSFCIFAFHMKKTKSSLPKLESYKALNLFDSNQASIARVVTVALSPNLKASCCRPVATTAYSETPCVRAANSNRAFKLLPFDSTLTSLPLSDYGVKTFHYLLEHPSGVIASWDDKQRLSQTWTWTVTPNLNFAAWPTWTNLKKRHPAISRLVQGYPWITRTVTYPGMSQYQSG